MARSAAGSCHRSPRDRRDAGALLRTTATTRWTTPPTPACCTSASSMPRATAGPRVSPPARSRPCRHGRRRGCGLLRPTPRWTTPSGPAPRRAGPRRGRRAIGLRWTGREPTASPEWSASDSPTGGSTFVDAPRGGRMPTRRASARPNDLQARAGQRNGRPETHGPLGDGPQPSTRAGAAHAPRGERLRRAPPPPGPALNGRTPGGGQTTRKAGSQCGERCLLPRVDGAFKLSA
jgi:hypothetical protein